MSTDKKTENADLNALAIEALDLWRDHLASYAADPAARAELARLMAPTSRVFAEWASMMQHGLHGRDVFKHGSAGNKSAPATGAKAAWVAPDNGAVGLAQLAGRMAELEERLGRLEALLAGKAKPSSSARKRKSGD